ncbi:MAG: hypothetical protein HQ541_05700 [Mariniphaga sp.]|nr:hypothetical protein [Mariniphaga sp.]
MKRINLIHKEPDNHCFEVLKRSLVEDKELKKFGIDENTLLQNLPEKIVNNFLEFLGIDKKSHDLMLRLNKSGALIIEFEEELIFDT